MGEICNNCGCSNHHNVAVIGTGREYEYTGCTDCPCTSFTARPDEKCGICLSNPAEADGCCPECRDASEPALLKWQNHEDGQTIARLRAERSRREDADKLDEHGMLPCPRCGGHFGLMSNDHNNPTWWTAHCDCLIRLNLWVEIGDDTREGLIRKLNTRPVQNSADTSESGE